jgi:hypothetical protein
MVKHMSHRSKKSNAYQFNLGLLTFIALLSSCSEDRSKLIKEEVVVAPVTRFLTAEMAVDRLSGAKSDKQMQKDLAFVADHYKVGMNWSKFWTDLSGSVNLTTLNKDNANRLLSLSNNSCGGLPTQKHLEYLNNSLTIIESNEAGIANKMGSGSTSGAPLLGPEVASLLKNHNERYGLILNGMNSSLTNSLKNDSGKYISRYTSLVIKMQWSRVTFTKRPQSI